MPLQDMKGEASCCYQFSFNLIFNLIMNEVDEAIESL